MKLADPNISEIVSDIEDAQTSASTYAGRKNSNHLTRLAQWDGQSDDGKKWSNNIGRQAFPWDGSSDSRVRLADSICNENARMKKQAFFRAKLQLVPVEPGDFQKKKSAEDALNYLLYTRCEQSLRREVELAAQYSEEYGLAIMGVFWRTTTRTETKTIVLQDILDVVKQGDQEAAYLVDRILSEDDEEAGRIIEASNPDCDGKKASKALREKGVYEYETSYIFESLPEWVALEPFEDVIFPPQTFDLQRAEWIAYRELINETEIRERIVTEGYSEEWVERAVKQKGAFTDTFRWASRQGLITIDDENLIEVLTVYRKETTEDNSTRIVKTIVHTSIVDDWAKHELLDYEHGQFPFVAMPRERIRRALIESRGTPEILETDQAFIKSQIDFRKDRASISILPPLRVPANRGKIELMLGPAVQLPERRPGEFSWMEPPRFDNGALEVEATVRASIDDYFGRMSPTGNPSRALLAQQDMVDGWLGAVKECIVMTLQLAQQYMTDMEVARLAGKPLVEPFNVSREEIQGRYDLLLVFDSKDMDQDALAQKLKYISDVIVPLDTMGVIDRPMLTRLVVSSIDPHLADVLVKDIGVVTQQTVEDEQGNFAKIAAGTEPPIKENPDNAQLRLQTLQQIVQSNPAVQQRYQQDEIFRKMLDARMQAFQFSMQQQQNAQIGKTGATPALQEMAQQAGMPGGMA
jgi:hypothetical protein